MPKVGSQITLCNMPVRMDTYKGCSHGCKYCFTYRKYNISNIKPFEGAIALKSFINGKRTPETSWCDWNIPIHWGGMSDPFQPAEKIHKRSLECLKVLAETQYPFIVSTKALLPTQEPYYSLFKKCNFVFQVSMLCDEYDKLEQGAPTFRERLKMLEMMAKYAKRVIPRAQPYILEHHDKIMGVLKEYKKAGVYGVIFESIKMQIKTKGLIRDGNDFIYPLSVLKPKFLELRDECHKHDLKFLSGENRLRRMGDSLTCCGTEGLEGFTPNLANLNQFLYDKKSFKYTEAMKKEGTAFVFQAMKQSSDTQKLLNKLSYKEVMEKVCKDRRMVKSMLDTEEEKDG